MNTRIEIKSLFLGAILGTAAVLSIGAVGYARSSIEYKTAYNLSEKELNKLGEEGWEVVGYAFSARSETRSQDVFHYVFKRGR
jgi:hypothetical protein